ncbi:MAG TPA: phosphoglucomutase [Roseiflexaceae bacterium]|jgi:phosphomannomutase|nr:phosphoglucomutase [Roseiflexaceae bacterium]
MTQRSHLHCSEWDGVYTANFTLESVQRYCWQIGDALLAQNWTCLIAYDTRFLSGQYARYIYQLLIARGVRASLCPTPAPIPTIYRALEQKRADSALVVSAGNRPHWYNGLMFITPLETEPLQTVTELPVNTMLPMFPPQDIPATEQMQIDLRSPYLEVVRDIVDIDLIRRSALTVFVDPMNGTASGYIPALLGEGSQTKAVEINREMDPLFGRQVPHPFETGVPRLRKLVKESDSHLGVAISADGRVISLVDNTGELVPPLELALLLAQYLSRQYRVRGAVVVPLPESSAGLRRWEEATGLKVEALADPRMRINELIAQDSNDLLVGITPSSEVTLGRYSESPDAILVAMLLIELAVRAGGRTRAQIDELRERMTSSA